MLIKKQYSKIAAMVRNVASLADRVREFDEKVGSKLKPGYVLTNPEYGKLDNLLKDSGYSQYGILFHTHLYTRITDCIDILIDHDVRDSEEYGFAYFKLESFRELNNFENAYIGANELNVSYLMWAGLGFSCALAGAATYLFGHHTAGVAMCVGGLLNTFLPLRLETKRCYNEWKKVMSYNPITDPREAIRNALDFYSTSAVSGVIGSKD